MTIKGGVCFVILHYMAMEATTKCIESIGNLNGSENINIVVVDNASLNDTGFELQRKYKEYTNITVILLEKNIGFAKGNNVGFLYAKNVLCSEIIVMTNNDIIFIQKDFLNRIYTIYDRTKCHVLGPDVIKDKHIHQSPLRDHVYSKQEIIKKIFVKSVYLYYYKFKKIFQINDKIRVLEYLFEKKDKKTQENRKWRQENSGCVLMGACIIFLPDYVKNETEAFLPDTFMYGEEDLLAYKCLKRNYKMIYSPEIQVQHMHGESTKKIYKDELDKTIFTYEYIVKGWKILLKKMKSENF